MHLNVRSSYSLLSGLMDVKTIAKKAREEKMRAVVLSDYHVLFGAPNFQKACLKEGVKPLFGMDISLDSDAMVTAIAKNIKGYQALIKLSYQLSKHPSISLSDLAIYGENLVVIIHGEGGFLESKISNKENESLLENLIEFARLLPNFYVGISHQESQYFKEINKVLIDLCRNHNITPVAMNKVLYENPEDFEVYRVVRAIDKSTYYDDLTLVSAPNRHFLSINAMRNLYGDSLLEPIETIIDSCNVDISSLTTSLPQYNTGVDASEQVYLESLSKFGLNKRLTGNVTKEYADRLTYELEVINSMGFTNYFLIVYDVIRYAKKEGIYVGPGRGSSAGSLVAYSLGITDVDPIEYDLLFERFLNPMRISMPDIDIDFPDDKRDRVVHYAKTKYGTEHIGHIVIFGTMKAKQAFRDVARVFQVPVRTVDTLAKLITASSLQENYDNVPKFRGMISSDERLLKTFQYALKVEGLMRHTSLHPAGIVIAKDKLIDVVPLMDTGSDLDVIQYDMNHLEPLGLIKIDFLGLRNLTIIDNIVSQIRKNDPGFNIMKIPLDDAKTFKMLSQGDTVGLFQLESDGMTALLRKLKPHRFLDIVDTIALYRPGPMENIPLYLSSRENPGSVKYLHPDLMKITKSTFGVLIYQEQIMQVAQIMAGFDLAKADILRKAMGKKDPVQLSTLRQEFIEGVALKGYGTALGVELYDLIEKFANYGFNKSHSVAYGLVSYQMAYLKANYPHLFYNYLLTSAIGSETKTRRYLEESKKRGVVILGPSVQESKEVYTIQGNSIRVPLTLIKGISRAVALNISAERKRNGPYQSYFDAVSRLTLIGVRKNQIEGLIHAGAFDVFKESRASLLNALDEALRYTNIIKVEREGELSLNRDLVSEPTLVKVSENMKQLLSNEFDVLGFYLSEHPTVRLKDATSNHLDKHLSVGEVGWFVVMLDVLKHHKTKNGDPMAFITVSDNTRSVEAVVFPRVFEKHKELLKVGDILKFKLKNQQTGSVLVEDVAIIDQKEA